MTTPSQPVEGGSYLRDPKTGTLKKVTPATKEQAEKTKGKK